VLKLSASDEDLQKGLIITDNFSKLPILDFESYTDAIVKMIKNSYPNFTIGIYGEWGTGKTTLMKSIEKEFEGNKDNIITVWFDAWKYENEKQFALIPLLKVISYSIKDEGDETKRRLKDSLKEAAIFTVGLSTDVVSSLVSNYAGKEMGGLLKRSLEDATNKLIPQLKKLSEIDSNSIFYNGIKNIQEAIDELRQRKGGFKIVIFVDDLDRCSEHKILEILESIKIFLSLNGIIYILGISHDRVVELINKKYQTNNGEEYLKKFVQIPLTLTEWDSKEIEKLIDHLLENNIIDDHYKPIIEKNKELIASSMEENPREIKRFLNNLIISYEVFSRVQQIKEEEAKKTFLKQLLLVQILKSNWKYLYGSIMDSEGSILLNLKEYIPLDRAKVEKLSKEGSIEHQLKIIFEKYKNDERLWNLFDEKNYNLLIGIPWKNFRRALKLTEEIPSKERTATKSQILMLLQKGRIDEFNRRVVDESMQLDLIGADLEGADLEGADLEGARLLGAKLQGAKLQGADLTGAKLQGADLTGANLTGARLQLATLDDANLMSAFLGGANLHGAYLRGANLQHANLQGANLHGAFLMNSDLRGANLYDVDLHGAHLGDVDLRNSVIISLGNYDDLMVNESTNFDDAIIVNPELINGLSRFTKHIPQKTNKKDLRSILEQKGIDKNWVNDIMQSFGPEE
jgi:uncharacterized protein YjbI with pentapeptide repeats